MLSSLFRNGGSSKSFGTLDLEAKNVLKTRLGLQCQTPALSKVYFTRVGTIISGLKKFLVPKKSWSKKNLCPKKIEVDPKIFVPKKFMVPKRFWFQNFWS